MNHISRVPRTELFLLASSGLFSLALITLRANYSESIGYFFLIWNLFLAFVPWAASLFLKTDSGDMTKIAVFGFWLLFFPNAPYILTDLMHLTHMNSSIPVWFDVILILSFAWCALMFGFRSLDRIRTSILSRWGKVTEIALTTSLLFLSGFGVYLGRFLRWNSWDLLSTPHHLAGDVIHRIVDPFSHPRTWAVTIFLGVLLNLIYWSMKNLGDHSVVMTNTSSSSL